MKILAPSILSADFSALGADVSRIEKAGADMIHIDVMDGHFVPNLSYGAVAAESLAGKTALPFDIHLMIENADRYIPGFITENTRFITVHQEACVHLDRTVKLIRSLGVKAGVALNPATSLSTLDYMPDDVEMVLIMSVNPGFGGQQFINASMAKIAALAEIRERRGLSFHIEVDGGVCLENAGALAEAGADVFVSGASFFKAPDMKQWIEDFHKVTKGA
ncbi:MAG: ribulose-phosphate 3-epimerase [Clostridiales Family XIII bacterium]|jgi:ribulose-phosphate 3-epimerase|nr:ribulose-phosphate 3-epimerase [Clostridiales Family XIII bacterium]